MVHLPTPSPPPQKKIGNIINITLIDLLASFIVQILKKFFQQIQSYEMHNFWVQNGRFAQINFFFFFSENLLMSLVSFIHSFMPTCQKSKSNINLLVKYWQLKNTEISLAESLFWL